MNGEHWIAQVTGAWNMSTAQYHLPMPKQRLTSKPGASMIDYQICGGKECLAQNVETQNPI